MDQNPSHFQRQTEKLFFAACQSNSDEPRLRGTGFSVRMTKAFNVYRNIGANEMNVCHKHTSVRNPKIHIQDFHAFAVKKNEKRNGSQILLLEFTNFYRFQNKRMAFQFPNFFRPSTIISDQEGIFPYNINTIPSRNAMRKRKNTIKGITS